MRFRLYAGASSALAAGAITRACLERPNFYSSSVYIAQSNACLFILTNLALLATYSMMLGLQKMFYGPLRPVEVEQLWERAWFALTETALAMTIFRDEVGGWFLVMFTFLLISKVWNWLAEGRVEILEQQPPVNPRLFHIRLSMALALSVSFNICMLRFCAKTVLRQARPNMMVMFAFEFAVLTILSLSTTARYTLSLYEATVIRQQINDGRNQLRHRDDSTLSEEEIANAEIDASGWEEKGQWVFYLDIATDFFKLVLYLTFFCVLCMFHGMPIHIIRDVALTIRSFYKRVRDFAQFRQATRDMNTRYPDATAEEILREDVCIICRENMTVWQGPVSDADGNASGSRRAVDERQRAKKLPCGHLLHFACLRSWLERQQICPTCRTPVLSNTTTPTNQPQTAAPNAPVAPGPGQQPVGGPRVYTFGPFRLVLGARHGNGFAHNVAGTAANAPSSNHQRMPVPSSSANVQGQLNQIGNYIIHEINTLNHLSDQLQVIQALQNELIRLRTVNSMQGGPQSLLNQQHRHLQTQPALHTYRQASHVLDHHNLPAGLTLPPDWTLHPLQRIGSSTRSSAGFGNPSQIPRRDQQPSSGAQLAGATVEGLSSSQNPTSSSQLSAEQASEASPHGGIASASSTTDPQSKADVNDEKHSATYSLVNTEPQPGPSTGDADNTATSFTADQKTQSKGKSKAVTLEEEDDTEST